MCATENKEWINNITQIEEHNNRNEPRTFFSEIKKVIKQNTGLPYICKDNNNTVITQMDQILTDGKNTSVQS